MMHQRLATKSNEGKRCYLVNGDIILFHPRSVLFAIEGNRKQPVFIGKHVLLDFYEPQYQSDDDMTGVDIKIVAWYYERRREEFER